jgi:hypothetical protein
MLLTIAVSTKARASAGELPHTFTNLFGDGLRVTYSSVYSIHNDPRINKQSRDVSKNHNFFLSEGKLWMEVWPSQERVIVSLSRHKSRRKAIYRIEDVHITDYVPPSSNLADEHLTTKPPFVFGRDRGSACCLHLAKSMYHDLTSNETILSYDHVFLGISHVKSYKRMPSTTNDTMANAYLSRLYVFAPQPPFQLLARSSMFCFGFGTLEEGDDHYLNVTRNNKLRIDNKIYECPRINFVVGLTESSKDRAIISFGINDCSPRMIEVEKRELAIHTFSSFLVDKEV